MRNSEHYPDPTASAAIKYHPETEAAAQSRLMKWAAYVPLLRWFHHIPNGGFRNAREAAHLKAMGVKAGVSDLFLPTISPLQGERSERTVWEIGENMTKEILDVTCGDRTIWFQKNEPHTIYCDKRREEWDGMFGKVLNKQGKQKRRHLVIDPDIQCDFTDLPFPDHSFSLVVFDPPHIENLSENAWMRKSYGCKALVENERMSHETPWRYNETKRRGNPCRGLHYRGESMPRPFRSRKTRRT